MYSSRCLAVLLSLLLGNWFTQSESYSLGNSTDITVYFGSGSSIDLTATVHIVGSLSIGANGSAYLTMNPLAKLDVGSDANIDFMRGNISLLSGSSVRFGYEGGFSSSNVEIDGQLILGENATFAESISIKMLQDSRIILGPNAYYSRGRGNGIGIWIVNSTVTIGAAVSVQMDGFFNFDHSELLVGDMCKLHVPGSLSLHSSSFTMGSGASIELAFSLSLGLNQAVWTMGNKANLTIISTVFGILNIFGNVNVGDNSTLIIHVHQNPLTLWSEGSITIGANSILIIDHDCKISEPVVVPAHTTAEICELVSKFACSGCPPNTATSQTFTQPSSSQTSTKQVSQTKSASQSTVPLVKKTTSQIYTQPSSSPTSAKQVTQTKSGSTAAIPTPAATKASCSVFAGQDKTYSAFKMLLVVCMSVLQHRMFLNF